MNLTELKRKNSVSIYRCILDGINTAIPISKITGMSQLTVCELANEMVKRELLDVTMPRRNVKGRRIHNFQPSHKYFSAFIDIQKDFICTIGISTSGSVAERFDYPINFENHTIQEILNKYVIKRLKSSKSFKYCLGIYLLGDDKNEYIVDDDIIKSTKENLIVSAFSDTNKAKLFEFNGKCIVSLYSHIYTPRVDKASLMKAIPFDEICTYNGDLYFDSFDALQRIAMINLENMI